jgi:hypothetical protein
MHSVTLLPTNICHNSVINRVSLKQDSTPEGVSAELQIAATEAADSGPYFCQASNLYGRDQQLVQLLVQGKSIHVTRLLLYCLTLFYYLLICIRWSIMAGFKF